MLIYEILPLVGDVDAIVQIGGDDHTVRDLLQAPDGVAGRALAADDFGTLDAGVLLAGFVGPDPDKHIAPESLAAALGRLPVGGRVVLLLGWSLPELPYHLLLGPLVEAECQVLQAIPLDKVRNHGAHCAVIAARVDRLAPLRTHLDDSPIVLPGEQPDLRAQLRLVGEFLLGDLVSRPARQHLPEMQQRIRQLERDVASRDRSIAAVEKRLAALERELTRVRASTTFQVGNAFVEGARRPGRAIVSVPANLVRAWRGRSEGESAPTNGHTPAANDPAANSPAANSPAAD